MNINKLMKNIKAELDPDRKLPFRFDINIFDLSIAYLFKKSTQITRKSLMNMYLLYNLVDERIYESNPVLEARLRFMNRALEAMVKKGFESESSIITYCRSDVEDPEIEKLIKDINNIKRINYEEIKFMNKFVQDRLKYAHLLSFKDRLYDTIEKLDSGDYKTFGDINNELVDICKNVIMSDRQSSVLENDASFSLDENSFNDRVHDIVTRLKDPSRIIKTGIRSFNEILSPGFFSKRLYMFFGLPGGYKSMILLKILADIKVHNGNITPKKPGKRPTALLITMENDIDETIERLFNMLVTPEDIRGFTPKEVTKMLKETAQLTITKDNELDIEIRYYANKSISTDDLYTIIDDLGDENREVVCLILDYIKRIRPSRHGKDEKEELKHASDELKVLAGHYDIPVISAQQINRAGAGAVDAAMTSNKQDLAQFVGRANVANAWELNKGLCPL